MANTLSDVTLVSGTWVDAYVATGISAGTDLIVKNKSTAVAYIQVRSTVPVNNSTDGWTLNSTGSPGGDWTTVTKVPVGSRVWIRGSGKVFIQEFE